MVAIETLHLASMGTGTLVLGFIVLVLAPTIVHSSYQAFFGPLSKFPGPKIHAWTHVRAILDAVCGHQHDVMEEMHHRYGPVVRIGPNELSFTGPDAWRDIYGHSKAGQPGAFRSPNHYGTSNESIISSDDDNGYKHARIRRTLQPSFGDRSLKETEPLLMQWAAKMQEQLTQFATADDKTDILKLYNCTTFDIMGNLTFGENLGMLDNSDLSPWVQSIFAGIKFGTYIGGIKSLHWTLAYVVDKILMNSKAVKKMAQEHENYSDRRVDRRLQRIPEHPDLWTKILEKKDTAQALSTKEHYSTAAIFMIAGTETSATALSGMTYYLLRNPQTMAKLVEEIRSTFSSSQDIHLDVLPRLKYLAAVVHEGLRLYPPVPGALPRVTPSGGMVICGEYVPADVQVGVHQIATTHSEAYFSKADEFHPERWLGDPEFANDQLNANEPFSIGTRNCIGKTLAYHEMRLLLTTVILNFDLELCEESADWRQQKVYGLWEKKPLMVKAKLVGRP